MTLATVLSSLFAPVTTKIVAVNWETVPPSWKTKLPNLTISDSSDEVDEVYFRLENTFLTFFFFSIMGISTRIKIQNSGQTFKKLFNVYSRTTKFTSFIFCFITPCFSTWLQENRFHLRYKLARYPTKLRPTQKQSKWPSTDHESLDPSRVSIFSYFKTIQKYIRRKVNKL